MHDLIRYGIAAAGKTRFEMRYFGGLKRYVEAWAADKERARQLQVRRATIEACAYCNDDGFLELHNPASGGLSVRRCSHEPERIERLLGSQDHPHG